MSKNRLLILILLFILLFSSIGCGNSPEKANNNEANDKQEIQTKDPKNSETCYGAIHTPFPNFNLTPDINSHNYPVTFEKDGKIGFKDVNGNIIVEPIYTYANGFWQGVGRVRIDRDEEYIWKAIDVYGNLYNYDEVYGFAYGLSPVSRGGKYGFINTAGELVVPLIYDQLYCAYNNDARSTYAVRDGEFVYLDLSRGYEEAFERYDINKKSNYSRIINLNDYDIVVVNDMLLVNGTAQPCSFDFPIYVLQDLDFDLYTDSIKLGTYKAKLIPGYYEGEIFLSFPEYDQTLANDTDSEYYAVLSSCKINNRAVNQSPEIDKFIPTVKQYLKSNNIENTPFAIDIAIEGDISANGSLSALIEINDTYRKEDLPQPFKEDWTEQKFANDRAAFVNTILRIDDLNKPLEYSIIKSNIWTHTEWEDYKTENIGVVANLDTDEQLELLIANHYYEYLDYAILDLK